MTKYKQALRRHGVKLEHEYDYLPFYDGNVTLEGRRVIFKHDYIFVTSYYDEVGLVTNVFDKDFNSYTVLDKSPEDLRERCTHFVIWDDMPTLRFHYDIDDNLLYIVKEA